MTTRCGRRIAVGAGDHVSSMSKTYGLPGLRIGWLACRDPSSSERLLAAKEQILISAPRSTRRSPPRARRARADPAADPGQDRAPPGNRAGLDRAAGRVRMGRAARRRGRVPARSRRDSLDPDRFYDSLLREHGTYVGPGHWFGQTGARSGSGSRGRRPTSSSAAWRGSKRPPRRLLRVLLLLVDLDLLGRDVGQLPSPMFASTRCSTPRSSRGPGSGSARPHDRRDLQHVRVVGRRALAV